MTKKMLFMQTVAFVVSVLALPFLLACDRNCEEHNGVCACFGTPEVVETEYAKPSDEEVPQDKMPSYQREGINAANPPSLVAWDEALDRAKAKAEQEGKDAAGLR